MAATGVAVVSGPRLGPYPVMLPRLGDPRLAQSVVLLSVQGLGQTVLGFPLSVPQILVSLVTCAVMELVVTFFRRRVIMWPASALLTGNGVALLLRHPGTDADQPWATTGLGLFAGVAALSMLTKYLIRWRGRHLFNPSNAGLLIALLALGSQRADLQVLYWGQWRPSLAVALALIVGGAVVVTRRAGISSITVAYLVALGAGLAVLQSGGHCIAASWHPVPLCDGSLWWRVMSSPETLIFAAFMVTDPKTVPGGRGARVAFGALTGLGSVLLAGPAGTEFGTKVALLAGLALACGMLAVARAVAAAAASPGSAIGLAGLGRWLDPPPPPPTITPLTSRPTTSTSPVATRAVIGPGRRGGGRLLGVGVSTGSMACALILLAGLPARSVQLAANPAAAPDPADGSTGPPARPTSASSDANSVPESRRSPGDRMGGEAGPLAPWPTGVDAPNILIQPEVAAWAPWFTSDDGKRRSRGLVRDLEARRRRAAQPAVRYVEVVVLMVRQPGSAQDAPEIGFRVRRLLADGTERTDLFRLMSRGPTFVIAGAAEAWSS